MPKNKFIKELIFNTQWAITDEALKAIYAAVDNDALTREDYKLFHQKEPSAFVFSGVESGTLYTTIKDGVGFIEINGPIVPRARLLDEVSGVVSIQNLMKEFEALENNPNIKSIALLLDSPGGAVTGVSDFAAMVKNSNKATYGFVWMAASAAYWIASAVDVLVSSDVGKVGSVGTVITVRQSKETDEIQFVSSQSPNKRVDVTTKEGATAIQKLADDLAEVFVSTVASNRNVTREKVISDFGQGGVLVAPEALRADMIDKIQDVTSFINDLTGSLSNSVFIKTTEVNMSGENQMPTMEELKNQYPSVVGEIAAAAALEERARIQSIEKVLDEFSDAVPAVKKAARAKIDELKFDADATPESVSVKLLSVVSQAQVKALEAFAKPRLEAASLVKSRPVENEPDPDAESKQRANALIKARDEMDGRVNNVS